MKTTACVIALVLIIAVCFVSRANPAPTIVSATGEVSIWDRTIPQTESDDKPRVRGALASVDPVYDQTLKRFDRNEEMDSLPERQGLDGLTVLLYVGKDTTDDPVMRCWAIQHIGGAWGIYTKAANSAEALTFLEDEIQAGLALPPHDVCTAMPFPPAILMAREALLALSHIPEERMKLTAILDRIYHEQNQDFIDIAAQVTGEQKLSQFRDAIQALTVHPRLLVSGAAREALTRIDKNPKG